MIRLKTKNYKMILTEKQQKYQHSLSSGIINKYEYLQVKKYYIPIEDK